MKEKINIATVRQFGNIEFLARQMVEGFITGLHKSPYHGFSVEFAEHRLYNTGESTRHIDWKVFAKTDRLYTKRYEEETNLRCQILIDSSSSMYYPAPNYDKITFSIMAAACLSYMLQNQRDAVGISTFSQSLELQTPIKSTPTHLHSLFILLEKLLKEIPKEKKTSVASVIHQIADKINKRSLVIIFSDMFDNEENLDDIFSSLQHLKHNNHEVLLFHVLDSKTEEEFDFEERPYEFIDIENGEKIKLQPSQIKEHYKRAIKSYHHDLKLKCGQYKIDFITADVNKGIEQILQSYLIKRTKMK
ncbi:MAG: DUF58 domain-containing protein [Cytophagaceae bacterium]|nr:DUF58 domain-containing protein [Cytophagaceae bacterium]